MIVLAVTTGFFAESLRENLGDKAKEKQVIVSLVKCLASDTTQLDHIITANSIIATYLDSIIALRNADLTTEENKRKFYDYGLNGFYEDYYFKTNDAAMQQLKSAGMLRLIKKQNIIDSIFGYELKNKATVAQESDNYFFFKESLMDFNKVVDAWALSDTSFTTYTIVYYDFFIIKVKNADQLSIVNDKEKLHTVFNDAGCMSVCLDSYVKFMQEQRDYAKHLIGFLNNEYQLKYE